MRSIFLILIPTLLFSCTDVHRAGRLERINILTERIQDKLDTPVKTISDSVRRVLLESDSLMNQFSEVYNEDTIDYQLAIDVDQLKQSQRELNNAFEQLKRSRIQLEERLNLCNALKNDVEQDAGERDKYDQNISFEEEQVNALLNQLETAREHMNNCLRLVQEVYPPILESISTDSLYNAE